MSMECVGSPVERAFFFSPDQPLAEWLDAIGAMRSCEPSDMAVFVCRCPVGLLATDAMLDSIAQTRCVPSLGGIFKPSSVVWV
jgi:hypothetical protein